MGADKREVLSPACRLGGTAGGTRCGARRLRVFRFLRGCRRSHFISTCTLLPASPSRSHHVSPSSPVTLVQASGAGTPSTSLAFVKD